MNNVKRIYKKRRRRFKHKPSIREYGSDCGSINYKDDLMLPVFSWTHCRTIQKLCADYLAYNKPNGLAFRKEAKEIIQIVQPVL